MGWVTPDEAVTAEGAVSYTSRRRDWLVDDGEHLLVLDGSALITFRKRDGRSAIIPIRRPLPAPLEQQDDAVLLRSIHGPQQALPEPSLPSRIRRLIAAPDGWIWLEPVQPPGLAPRVEVLRIHLATGTQRTDTARSFRPHSTIGVSSTAWKSTRWAECTCTGPVHTLPESALRINWELNPRNIGNYLLGRDHPYLRPRLRPPVPQSPFRSFP